MSDMNLKIYLHGNGLRYIRASEIPEPLRSRFIEAQFGAQQPIIPGVPERDAFYAWDWERFVGNLLRREGPLQ